jgi:hypothetical protein
MLAEVHQLIERLTASQAPPRAGSIAKSPPEDQTMKPAVSLNLLSLLID